MTVLNSIIVVISCWITAKALAATSSFSWRQKQGTWSFTFYPFQFQQPFESLYRSKTLVWTGHNCWSYRPVLLWVHHDASYWQIRMGRKVNLTINMDEGYLNQIGWIYESRKKILLHPMLCGSAHPDCPKGASNLLKLCGHTRDNWHRSITF